MTDTELLFRLGVTGVILFVMYLVAVSLIGGLFGLPVYIVIPLTLVFIVGQYFVSQKLRLYRVGAYDVTRNESPEIYGWLDDLAGYMEMETPRLMFAPMGGLANAFGIGRPKSGTVVVSEQLMKILNNRELYALLGHELTHIKNRDMIVMTAAESIGSFLAFPFWLIGPLLKLVRTLPRVQALLFRIARSAKEAAKLATLAVSRVREYRADEFVAQELELGEEMINALRKIQEVNRQVQAQQLGVPASQLQSRQNNFIARLLRTHPTIQDRVRRIKEQDPSIQTER
ncbi:MAG: M48 family metalloprotease [Candidatus Nanohaloarchaea archaeon]|nr:M48 family metalloprotease [Candidatus Nanohaloarchaea archaeon]